jgi:hypothetical protein
MSWASHSDTLGATTPAQVVLPYLPEKMTAPTKSKCFGFFFPHESIMKHKQGAACNVYSINNPTSNPNKEQHATFLASTTLPLTLTMLEQNVQRTQRRVPVGEIVSLTFSTPSSPRPVVGTCERHGSGKCRSVTSANAHKYSRVHFNES